MNPQTSLILWTTLTFISGGLLRHKSSKENFRLIKIL